MKRRYRVLRGLAALIVLAIGAGAVVISHDASCTNIPDAAGDDIMRAARYTCYGGPEVIHVVAVAKPVPGPNELLVRVEAAAFNPYDWHFVRGSPYVMRLGIGIGAPGNPALGVDFAGVVEAVGADVTGYAPGDAVFGGASGAFAEYVTVHEDGSIARKPENVSFAEAAAVPIAGATALEALRDAGAVDPGDRVLINGASGGVGTYAVQIAKHLGADVSGVCSTRNVEMVRGLGADRVFDYTQEDYTASDETFDVIVDMVGNHSLSANRRVMAPDGRMIIIGGPKGDWIGPLKGPLKAMLYSPFVDQEFRMMVASMRGDDLAVLADLMAEGVVTSQIDRVYPLAELQDAMAYSESGRARGKIIITMDVEEHRP